MVSPELGRAAGSSGGNPFSRREPVLVTGAPRSGTTWLARELATLVGTGLPGREPMNPRRGQFALDGTLTGWTQLTDPSARQARILKRCYRGHEPRTYSRYGVNQWAAVLPWSRTMVKDPFALLSVPAIVRCTGALPIVVYRHPGAVLASYRRMGWNPDLAEIRALQGATGAPRPASDVAAMVEFWTFLHRCVLDWLPDVPGAVLVSHAEASSGGTAALRDIARCCGFVREPGGVGASRSRKAASPHLVPAASRLHRFERSSQEVTEGWRARMTREEIDLIEEGTEHVWRALQERRLPLAGL